jgi:hypothetical protein
VLLKLYIYGYLNRVQSSRRLEHECQRNVELMWLTGRLAPDFKFSAELRQINSLADFRLRNLLKTASGGRPVGRRSGWQLRRPFGRLVALVRMRVGDRRSASR